MASSDDRAAHLLERLLTDPVLRAQFRRDPASVARAAELEELAGDFAEGTAMETLETRESRSSLAGVMMAAALEGVAGLGLAHAAAASGQGLPPEVSRVLDRHPDAPSAPGAGVAAADPSDLDDLVTPEGAAADRAASQPAGPWSSNAPRRADAGVFPVVDPKSDAGASGTDGADAGGPTEDGASGDTDAEADQESDGGDSEDEEEDEDEDEGGAAWDAQDEATHDQDSDGDQGDPGAGQSDPGAGQSEQSPSAEDPGPVPDEAAPVDEVQPGAGAGTGDATSRYPGDDKPPAEIAAWMGREARRRGLPPELPVMASLVESGMRNLSGGDRDSVGFFQMRLGIWNNGDYEGYPSRPELQLKWFLDKAVEVKAQRVAQGRSVTDRSQYGEWIADVERPAAQYRGRYQLRLEEAAGFLPASDSAPGPDPDAAGEVVDAVTSGGSVRPAPRATAAIEEARKHLGTAYQWGGSSPQTGFDCSGLVQWAYAKVGIRIPRTTDTQFAAPSGAHVERRELIPGDVVFFRDPAGSIHHEGIYLGEDKFLHAPHTGDVVKISSLDESYYAQQFAGGRRFARGVQAASAAAEASAAPSRTSASPASVRAAMTAVERDAAEARRSGTLLFEAVRQQEGLKSTIQYPRS